MSASLVGSEMCIRDSGTPSERPRNALGTPSERPLGMPTKCPETALGMPCLLYTSDAADDM
eukprot:683701-Alexandrium_andersonii.AAC.1